MFRTPLSWRRALAALALPVLATGVAGSPAATAAEMPTCAGYNVMDEWIVFDRFQVGVDSVSPTETRVCFSEAGLVVGTVVVHHDPAITQPGVTVTPGTGRCAQQLWDSYQPVQFQTSGGADQDSRSVCFELDAATITVAVHGVDGVTFEVWRPGTGSALDVAACSLDFVFVQTARALPEFSDEERAEANWAACAFTAERIL